MPPLCVIGCDHGKAAANPLLHFPVPTRLWGAALQQRAKTDLAFPALSHAGISDGPSLMKHTCEIGRGCSRENYAVQLARPTSRPSSIMHASTPSCRGALAGVSKIQPPRCP